MLPHPHTPGTGPRGRLLLQPVPFIAQTSIGSRPRFCLFTTNTLCPDTVTSSVCSPKTTDRRLKGMFVPWCNWKPQAVLTNSEMALAACSSFSRSPDDCVWMKEGRSKRQTSELGTNSRHRTSASYTYDLPLYLPVVPNYPASEKYHLQPLYDGAVFPCAILFLILKCQASFDSHVRGQNLEYDHQVIRSPVPHVGDSRQGLYH